MKWTGWLSPYGWKCVITWLLIALGAAVLAIWEANHR